MTAFSDKYQDEIHDIVKIMLSEGYTVREVVVILSEIISHVASK